MTPQMIQDAIGITAVFGFPALTALAILSLHHWITKMKA